MLSSCSFARTSTVLKWLLQCYLSLYVGFVGFCTLRGVSVLQKRCVESLLVTNF